MDDASKCPVLNTFFRVHRAEVRTPFSDCCCADDHDDDGGVLLTKTWYMSCTLPLVVRSSCSWINESEKSPAGVLPLSLLFFLLLAHGVCVQKRQTLKIVCLERFVRS